MKLQDEVSALKNRLEALQDRSNNLAIPVSELVDHQIVCIYELPNMSGPKLFTKGLVRGSAARGKKGGRRCQSNLEHWRIGTLTGIFGQHAKYRVGPVAGLFHERMKLYNKPWSNSTIA